MDWISTSEFKTLFKAAANSSDGQVELAVQSAEDELRGLVGEEAVDDTLLATPTDETRAGRIVRGHKFIAASLFLFNVRTVKREHDTGSPAISGGMVINEYYSPKELKELSEQWRAQGLNAIGPYLIADAQGDEFGAAAEYSHPTSTSSCPNVCGTVTVATDLCN